MVKSGVIIGASVTDSPHRPRGRKEYETVVDRREAEGGAAMLREVPKPNVNGEARWIRKAGQLRFGYKRHTVTDPNGIILAEATPGTSMGSYAGPTCPGASLSPPTRATPRRRIGHPAGRGSRRASSSSTQGLAGRGAGLSVRLTPCADGSTGARRGTWDWPERMRSTSWRPSPTTCTAPRGSLWPTPKKREKSVKSWTKRPAGVRLEGKF